MEKLTKKEQRLFDYYAECEARGFQPTIGDICNACHTTPWTLCKKTHPGLMAKLERLDEQERKAGSMRKTGLHITNY
jgi:hypothetical protein